jgi:16S rRNA processing protein RimM
MSDPVRLEVGRVGRAHGLRGEVHVVAVTNRSERFAPGSQLFVGERELVVDSSRPSGSGWVVKFAGVDDRDAAEALRTSIVRGEAPGAAPEGELWVHEVIGAEVRDRSGARIGIVDAVQANPAHDLLLLDTGALVPMVFVVEHEPGVVVVDLPDGLLDL